MPPKNIEASIVEFIEGESPDEGLARWVAQSAENRDTLFEMKEIYDCAGRTEAMTEEQIEAGWHRLAAECGTTQSPRTRPLRPYHNARKLVRRVVAAAACIAIVAVGGLWFTASPKEDMVAHTNQTGAKERVILPDGSGVWLASGTTITYPRSFRTGSRRVRLAGEAFFEVVHNPAKPFRVASDLVEVEVLGTRFNMVVSGEGAQVVLESGSVAMRRLEGEAVRHKVILAPGEMGEVTRSGGRIATKKVEVEIYTSWKEPYLNFKAQTLATVARMVGRIYNTKITIYDEVLAQECFSGRFDSAQGLEEIFRIIDMTTPIEWRHDGTSWHITPK